ncbi:hypothetical protein BY458DRAFT_446840 [Sporodiniella umbellata]|nr:hypothetical protein BY458DRAFT_446840 [Sporodiniella umbellata]
MFCKCFCGSNSTVFELLDSNLKPCSTCTKQFCLDNVKDGQCDGIADATCPSNDFKTACFARDSYKDEVIIRTFLMITVGLVVYSITRALIREIKKVIRAKEMPFVLTLFKNDNSDTICDRLYSQTI